jgi:hypothetical protein
MVALGFDPSKWFTRGWTLQELLGLSLVPFGVANEELSEQKFEMPKG